MMMVLADLFIHNMSPKFSIDAPNDVSLKKTSGPPFSFILGAAKLGFFCAAKPPLAAAALQIYRVTPRILRPTLEV